MTQTTFGWTASLSKKIIFWVCAFTSPAPFCLLFVCFLFICRWALSHWVFFSSFTHSLPCSLTKTLHHTVRRTWLFIAYSDERWLYCQFSPPHLYISFHLEECTFWTSNWSGLCAAMSKRLCPINCFSRYRLGCFRIDGICAAYPIYCACLNNTAGLGLLPCHTAHSFLPLANITNQVGSFWSWDELSSEASSSGVLLVP